MARAAAERGDRTRALEALDRALALDPDFLAARALRERLSASPPVPRGAPAPAALVSAAGYARFEERARRRRVDRRLDLARDAIAHRRYREAAASVQEIRELDPNAPALADLVAALAAAKAVRHPRRFGAAALSAASFAAVVFAASARAPEPPTLVARQIAGIGTLATSPILAFETIDGTAGAEAIIGGTVDPPETVVANAAEPTPPLAPPLPAARVPVPIVPLVAPTTRGVIDIGQPPPLDPEAPPAAVAPVQPAVTPISAVVPAPAFRDESLVQQTLQRYRVAYEGLDAASAHAVWPAVDQEALARAFSGLASQSLTFDDCRVRLGGDVANVVCRGQTRYVPKVGNREPRVEPRTWTFVLRKSGPEWKIESARADR